MEVFELYPFMEIMIVLIRKVYCIGQTSSTLHSGLVIIQWNQMVRFHF